MDSFLQALEQYDASENIHELVKFTMASGKGPSDLVGPVHHFLSKKRFQTAFILSQLTRGSNFNNVILSFALAVGGCIYDDQNALNEALKFLRAAVLAANPHQTELIHTLTEPTFDHLAQMAIYFDHQPFTLNVLEVLKAIHPYLDRQFTWSDDVPDLDIEAIRQKGHQQSKLIQNALPPADAPKIRRRAVVAVRALSNPNDPKSRPQDIGPRIVTAMKAYGWDAHFYPIQCYNLAQDYQDIANLCLHTQADILVLDDHIIVSPVARAARADMLTNLRPRMPNLRIVAAHFDTWALPTDVLREACTMVDAVWESTSPSLPIWSDPIFQNKPILRTQLPHGGRYGQTHTPLKSHITFQGAVQGFNWHRVFWLAASKKYNLPIEIKLVTHGNDGLTAMESYGRFMESLAEATCSLNLSTRPNHMQIVTGRCFESMISGALLIQEETPDLDYYFIPGEHYIPFASITELRSICKFIQNHPAEAEEIRRRGTEFARDCYSDEKIVGYLDKMLYY